MPNQGGRKRHVTPIATTGFTAIQNGGKDGQLVVTCRFDGEARKQMESLLKQIVDEDPRKNAKPSGVKIELDPETEKETGTLLVTFKKNAEGKNRATGETFTQTINVVDSQKAPVTEIVAAGSRARVSFSTWQTEYQGTPFIRLSPNAVQVIELVEFGATGAADFDVVDEGFVSSGEQAAVKPVSDNTAHADAAAADF